VKREIVSARESGVGSEKNNFANNPDACCRFLFQESRFLIYLLVDVLPLPDDLAVGAKDDAGDEEDDDVLQAEDGVGNQLATGLGGVVNAVRLSKIWSKNMVKKYGQKIWSKIAAADSEQIVLPAALPISAAHLL
jgi:hypothetical protein